MRQVNVVAIGPVVAHQQPAGEPDLDAVMGVGNHAGGCLDHERVDIAQQKVAERHALVRRRSQFRCANGQGGGSIDLHEGFMRRLIAAQQQRCSGKSFATENADFGPFAVPVCGNDRGNSPFGEIDRGDRAIGRHQFHSAFQAHALQIRP